MLLDITLIVLCMQCLAHASGAGKPGDESLSLITREIGASARVQSLPGYEFDLPSEHFAGMCL